MRLATILSRSGSCAAVASEGGLVPIHDYSDVGALLSEGEKGIGVARRARETSAPQPFEKSEFLRPVLSPGAVVCVGLNYRSHIAEMGREVPTHPTLFSKLSRALTDPYAEIKLPQVTSQLDWEGELAVVIGKGGRNIDPADVWGRIAGFTVMNDVSARDLQRRSLQWFAGKTLEASTPIGPWVVTPDELDDLGRCALRVTLNGDVVQEALLDDLVFDVPTLVVGLSQLIELRPGDIIATGTPGGVGESRGRFLRDGDVVEVTITEVGTLCNTFRASHTC